MKYLFIIAFPLLFGCYTKQKPPNQKLINLIATEAGDSSTMTTIKLLPQNKYFGAKQKNSVLKDSFLIENTGKKTFYVKYLNSQCDCVSIISKVDSIRPGSSVVVEYEVKLKNKGFTRQTIVIVGNCYKGHIPFFIAGNIY